MEIEAKTLAYSLDIILAITLIIAFFYGQHAFHKFSGTLDLFGKATDGTEPSLTQSISIIYFCFTKAIILVVLAIYFVSTAVSTIQAIISLHNNQFNFHNPLRVFGFGT